MINSSFFEIGLIPANLSNKVTQVFESIKISLNATTNQIVNPARAATGQVIDTITDTAQKTQDSLKQTANQFINAMGETSEQGKMVLGNTFQTAEHFSNAVSKNMEQALNAVLAQQMNAINDWINAHPALSWATQSLTWGINHPILSLILLFFALFFIWQLFKVMSYWFEQTLVALLKAPFQFIWFLFTLSFKFLRRPTINHAKIQQTEVNSLALTPAVPALTPQEHQERVAKILTRIEVLRQEQNDLLQELTAILVSNKLSAD